MKAFILSIFSLLVLGTTTAFGAPIYANLEIVSVSRNMTTINPYFSKVVSAAVQFNSKSLTLTLDKGMPNCAPGMMCIMAMPMPLVIELDVVNVEQKDCSIVYTAATPADIKSAIYEMVTVEDYSHSTCEMLYTSVGTVTYSVTGISALTKKQETAKATFQVDGEFVRAQD